MKLVLFWGSNSSSKANSGARGGSKAVFQDSFNGKIHESFALCKLLLLRIFENYRKDNLLYPSLIIFAL